MNSTYRNIVKHVEAQRTALAKQWVLFVTIAAGSIPLYWTLLGLSEVITKEFPAFEQTIFWRIFSTSIAAYEQLIIVAVVLIIYDLFRRQRVFQHIVATELFTPLFQHYFPTLKHSHKSLISRQAVQQLPIFKHVRFNKCQLEDSITGTYKNLQVQIHEADISYLIRQSDKQVEKSLFAGLIMQVDFPITTGSTTIAYARGTNMHLNPNRIGEQVRLESRRFMDHFDIYSTNQRDARLHLKTHFMARLLDFLRKHPKRKIHLMFLNGKLIIFLAQDYNLFAHSVFFSPVKLEKVHAQLSQDTQLIKKILDDLSLERI